MLPLVFCGTPATAVYADGRVCISILHNPGDDPNGYETAAERWSPVQSVSIGLGCVPWCAVNWAAVM